jgi:hypothetical protein
MALIIISDKRHVNRGKPSVSINAKLRRIVINKSARELMIKNYGKEFEFVQLMLETEIPNVFFMAPCEEDDEGSRRLNAGTGATRSVSCSLLLNQLGYESDTTKSYAVAWDAVNRSIKVDLSQEEGGKKK